MATPDPMTETATALPSTTVFLTSSLTSLAPLPTGSNATGSNEASGTVSTAQFAIIAAAILAVLLVVCGLLLFGCRRAIHYTSKGAKEDRLLKAQRKEAEALLEAALREKGGKQSDSDDDAEPDNADDGKPQEGIPTSTDLLTVPVRRRRGRSMRNRLARTPGSSDSDEAHPLAGAATVKQHPYDVCFPAGDEFSRGTQADAPPPTREEARQFLSTLQTTKAPVFLPLRQFNRPDIARRKRITELAANPLLSRQEAQLLPPIPPSEMPWAYDAGILMSEHPLSISAPAIPDTDDEGDAVSELQFEGSYSFPANRNDVLSTRGSSVSVVPQRLAEVEWSVSVPRAPDPLIVVPPPSRNVEGTVSAARRIRTAELRAKRQPANELVGPTVVVSLNGLLPRDGEALTAFPDPTL